MRAGVRAILDEHRRRMRHTHGWEVELLCPECGTVGVPEFLDWTPGTALRFSKSPTVFADLKCPSCEADLKEAAGRALVENFAEVPIPSRNRRLLMCFLAYMLAFELGGTALVLFSSWHLLGGFLLRAPLFLLAPALMWLNGEIVSQRHRCDCGAPAYKFMGLVGRSSCYRCSSCGRLLRLRD